MKKDPKFYLGHIRDSINNINKYTKGLEKGDFLKNNLVQDAVVRNIEIIGEAVKNLPKEFTNKHKDVPWKDISGMRDRIAHFYFGIDYALVWDTVKKDIPELKKQIQKLL
jgi:uncharacterized protein with HEPN domain